MLFSFGKDAESLLSPGIGVMIKGGKIKMTTHERFQRMYEHREADRIPIIDSPWNGTLSRWKREGMPENVDWRDFFDVDKVEPIGIDISPRYERKILEETERYVIFTSEWGVTMKQFKEEDSTPEFLDFTVVTPERWEEAKARMTLDRDRVNWAYLKKNYDRWKRKEDGFREISGLVLT